jgi:hypothetical protein
MKSGNNFVFEQLHKERINASIEVLRFHRVEYSDKIRGFNEKYHTLGSFKSLQDHIGHRLVQIGRIDGPTEYLIKIIAIKFPSLVDCKSAAHRDKGQEWNVSKEE